MLLLCRMLDSWAFTDRACSTLARRRRRYFRNHGISRHLLTSKSGFLFCAAGQGFRMAARSELSLAKNVLNENISHLYILIFYMDMIGGGLFNAWILARTFNEGLDQGGASIGLPIFVAVAEWCIVALIVITAKGIQLQKSKEMSGATRTPLLMDHSYLMLM